MSAAALAVRPAALVVSAQITPGGVHSVIRPGALNDIPQHLTEIGWDTDAPSLFAIRYLPEKMNFEPGWSSWVTGAMLKRTGFIDRLQVNPWPPIFAGNSSFVNMPGGQLSPQDMQAFQAWCMRRAQGDPANPRPYRALSSAIRRRSDRPRPASRASAGPIERKPER